jgi:hypothetical protein
VDDGILQKKSFSAKTRLVFFAGLGATGHHAWKAIMNSGHHCRGSLLLTDKLLFNLYYTDHADRHYSKVVAAFKGLEDSVYCVNLAKGNTMYSYPNKGHPTHHPNIVLLASAAEAAGVDLRIIVLTRAPEPSIVSTALHRKCLRIKTTVPCASRCVAPILRSFRIHHHLLLSLYASLAFNRPLLFIRAS